MLVSPPFVWAMTRDSSTWTVRVAVVDAPQPQTLARQKRARARCVSDVFIQATTRG